MSENFDMKKAAAAGLAIGAGLATATGFAVGTGQEKAPQANIAEAPALTPDIVKTLVEAAYDRADVVGEIQVVQGTDLINEAEKIVSEALGEEVYRENRGHLYDYLLETSQYYTSQAGPHPGDVMYVIQGDFDNNPENGDEYVVTDGRVGGIIEASTNTVPSPTQIVSNTQLETLDK